jgi:hypothetical protein
MIDDQKCPPATDLDSHADLHGEETPVVIHGVHHVFHPPVALSEWPDAAARASCSLPATSRAKRCSRNGRQAARQLKTVAAIRCGNLPMSVVALSGASSRLEVLPLARALCIGAIDT